ncbi:hypothetical protein ACFLZ8_05740 [Planctomycetota bacterium]
MKKVNQKLLCGCLVILVVVLSAFPLSAVNAKVLSNSEMAFIKGSSWECAYCIDVCDSAGSEEDCDEDQSVCFEMESWWLCHQHYTYSLEPFEPVWYCSTYWGEEEIECSPDNNPKYCLNLAICWCHEKSDPYFYDWCEVEEFPGINTLYDECDP